MFNTNESTDIFFTDPPKELGVILKKYSNYKGKKPLNKKIKKYFDAISIIVSFIFFNTLAKKPLKYQAEL